MQNRRSVYPSVVLTSQFPSMRVSQRHLEDAALQTVSGGSGTLGSVDQGLAHLSDLEHGGGLNVVPVLSGEGIDHLLLGSLLASDL